MTLRTTVKSIESLQALYAPVQEDLKIVERIFDEELDGGLRFVSELCDTVRSYRGKMIRPALLLLTAKAFGPVKPVHHTLAAVVEMVHMATLVHDDVLDEADERRRRPTINKVAGNVAAVLLGDYLISHAFHLCSSLDDQHASRRVGATTNTVCEGELLQNHLRGKLEMSEADYFDIVERKTAALTAVSCELGARYAAAGDAGVEALRAYGMCAGVAFQVIDDVLDVVGERSSVGKTLGTDAASGKLTLPTIHCLSMLPGDAAKIVGRALDGDAAEHKEVISEYVQQTGSIDYALGVARVHVANAVQSLQVLPPSDAKESLIALAEFIVARHF